MKGKIATLIAGIALGSTGVAGAASMDLFNNDVWCKPASGGVACVTMTGRYGVGIHKNFVIVMDNNSKRVIFKRYQ